MIGGLCPNTILMSASGIYLFLTEDVFKLFSEIFTLDYVCSLRFQTYEASEDSPQAVEPLPASATDDILLGV